MSTCDKKFYCCWYLLHRFTEICNLLALYRLYCLYQIVFNIDLKDTALLYYIVMSLLCVNWGFLMASFMPSCPWQNILTHETRCMLLLVTRLQTISPIPWVTKLVNITFSVIWLSSKFRLKRHQQQHCLGIRHTSHELLSEHKQWNSNTFNDFSTLHFYVCIFLAESGNKLLSFLCFKHSNDIQFRTPTKHPLATYTPQSLAFGTVLPSRSAAVH